MNFHNLLWVSAGGVDSIPDSEIDAPVPGSGDNVVDALSGTFVPAVEVAMEENTEIKQHRNNFLVYKHFLCEYYENVIYRKTDATSTPVTDTRTCDHLYRSRNVSCAIYLLPCERYKQSHTFRDAWLEHATQCGFHITFIFLIRGDGIRPITIFTFTHAHIFKYFSTDSNWNS